VPVVGVGLLYQQGYFRQVIDKNGEQQYSGVVNCEQTDVLWAAYFEIVAGL